MSMVFNMVGAGSGKISAYAYIIVWHNAGSVPTCTNTDGSIALSVDRELFLVSDGATSCVVSCGGVTKTVAITAGESYYVDLRGVLYQAGDTGGWTAVAWAAISGFNANKPNLTFTDSALKIDQTGYHCGVTYHNAKVDLTDYNYVTAHGKIEYSRSSDSGGVGIYIFSQIGSGYYIAQSVANTQVGTGTKTDYNLSVNVASLTGEYYVGFGSVITTHHTFDSVYCGI